MGGEIPLPPSPTPMLATGSQDNFTTTANLFECVNSSQQCCMFFRSGCYQCLLCGWSRLPRWATGVRRSIAHLGFGRHSRHDLPVTGPSTQLCVAGTVGRRADDGRMWRRCGAWSACRRRWGVGWCGTLTGGRDHRRSRRGGRRWATKISQRWTADWRDRCDYGFIVPRVSARIVVVHRRILYTIASVCNYFFSTEPICQPYRNSSEYAVARGRFSHAFSRLNMGSRKRGHALHKGTNVGIIRPPGHRWEKKLP